MLWAQIKYCLIALAVVGWFSGFGAGAQDAPKISKLGLAISYQRETSELLKRDLALKIIDSGLLSLYESTAADVAKIFGRDWAGDVKVDKGDSYGIISFAKQPPEMPAGHVATTGWYMVVYYHTGDKKLFDWDLSNVHK